MKRFAGVLFDKDGTLFDFHATWGPWSHGFIARLASHGDGDRAGPLAEAMGYDLGARRFRPDSVVIAGSVDDWVAEILPLLPDWDHDGLVTHIKVESAEVAQIPATDLDPLFGGLRARGYSLGIATNDGIAAVTRQLADAGIDHHFDFVAGYDSGFGAKPGPGMLLAFAAHVGAAPARVVMVGDSPHDLVAGRAAGMVPVGVLTGMAGRAELAPLADIVLDSIADLPRWLENPDTTAGMSQTGMTPRGGPS